METEITNKGINQGGYIMKKTAQYRDTAMMCEGVLCWSEAALYWQKALDVYPSIGGNLVALDKQNIRERMRTCQSMAGSL